MDNLSSESVSCKNCGHQYNGFYCPQCGQKHITTRITVKESLKKWLGVIVNLEKGLWPTSWLMFKDPKKVINDYLNGITVPYSHPFRFLFLWLTVQVFLILSSGVFDMTQGNFYTEMQGQPQQMNEGQQKLLSGVKQYLQLFLVLSMPFLAMATKLFFRQRSLNFAEHLVVNSYAYGASLILSLLMIPFYYFAENHMVSLQLIGMGVSIIYMAYVYSSIFYENVFLVVFKSVGVMLIWFIGMSILMIIGVIVVFSIQVAINPEILEKFKSVGS